MWTDIPKAMKEILNNDSTVSSLINTVRIGVPVRNIPDNKYPVVIIGTPTLNNSELRGMLTQDRNTGWLCPIYISIVGTVQSIEDGTILDTQEEIETSVVSAILKAAEWNNEEPFLDIELNSSDIDEEIEPPKVATIYNFNIRKINYIG